MPKQQPATSEQSVQTPDVFVSAACRKLMIPEFNFDLAADSRNTKVRGETLIDNDGAGYVRKRHFDRRDNALVQDWTLTEQFNRYQAPPWSWLNPEFADIYPWAQKCVEEAARGAWIAMLVPSSTGTEWWNDCVHGYAYVLALRGRVKFVGHTNQYPKDLALCLYTPIGFNGMDIWPWRESLQP